MFIFDISDELKIILLKLSKKDPIRTTIIYKKIQQIISCDKKSINHYKNLRYDLSEYKRAHIDNSFILLFKVTISKNHILFDKLKHHDEAYK